MFIGDEFNRQKAINFVKENLFVYQIALACKHFLDVNWNDICTNQSDIDIIMKKLKNTKTTLFYSNESADFIARVIPNSRKVGIEGLPFTLKAKHVLLGSATRFWIKKYWLKEFNQVKTEPISVDNIGVDGNCICFNGIKKFREKDGVKLFLIGPDKSY